MQFSTQTQRYPALHHASSSLLHHRRSRTSFRSSITRCEVSSSNSNSNSSSSSSSGNEDSASQPPQRPALPLLQPAELTFGNGGGQSGSGGSRGGGDGSGDGHWDGHHSRHSPAIDAILAAAALCVMSILGLLATTAGAAAFVLDRADTQPTMGQPEIDPSTTCLRTASQPQVAEQQMQTGTTPSNHLPKRIAFFIEPSPFTYMSGYQTRFLATIKELTAMGCEVLVITPGRGAAGGQAQPSEFEGARVVEVCSFPCPGYGTVPLSLGLSPRIFKEVQAWKPDVIHVTSPGALPIAAWLYSRILRVPLVASYHTHIPSYLPRLGLNWLAGGVWGLIRAIHRAAHITIAVSPKTAADLVTAGACERTGVKVWPKAVDCERFHPRRASPTMRARLAGGRDNMERPLLLYVGRVSPEKNVPLLLSVLEKVPRARLAIVGDGPALESMKEHFTGTPTVFTGKLVGTDLAAAYASADVFVMPSETETLGNVVGEAMASGLPVVAAAAGGVPSFISRPGQTGMLYPPGDANTAAQQVTSLLTNPRARHEMSRAARAEMERFSWRNATLEILRDHYPAAILANQAELERQEQIAPACHAQWA